MTALLSAHCRSNLAQLLSPMSSNADEIDDFQDYTRWETRDVTSVSSGTPPERKQNTSPVTSAVPSERSNNESASRSKGLNARTISAEVSAFAEATNGAGFEEALETYVATHLVEEPFQASNHTDRQREAVRINESTELLRRYPRGAFQTEQPTFATQQETSNVLHQAENSSSLQREMISASSHDWQDEAPSSPIRKRKAAETTEEKKKQKKRSKTLSSKYRGVSKCSKDGRWQARIRIGSVVKYLGRFKTQIEAAKRYDIAARELHGERAMPNFAPDGTPNIKVETETNAKETTSSTGSSADDYKSSKT